MTDTSQFRNFTTRYDPGMGLDLICDALNLGLYIGVDAASDASPTISSAIIKFIQSGMGAIAESVQAVLRRIYFDVQSYGATGDGSTDDTATIQKAFTAASAAGGGTVYFPKPSTYYKVTSPITIGSNIRVLGTGFSRVYQTTTQIDTFQINDGSSNVIIEGMWFDGTGTSTVGKASIHFIYSTLGFSDIVIRGNKFTNPSTSGIGTDPCQRLVVSDNIFNGCGNGNLYLSNALDTTVTGNVFQPGSATSLTAIQLRNGSVGGGRVSISGNTIKANGNSSDAAIMVLDVDLAELSITGNVITGAAGDGIQCAFTNVGKLQITGNTITGCSNNGIQFTSVTDAIISGNLITTNAANGVLLNSGCQYNHIVGNKLLDNNSSNNARATITDGGSGNNVICNNYIKSQYSNSNGIKTSGGSGSNFIFGNDVTQCAITQANRIVPHSTDKVRQNNGWVTENQVLWTITSGNTSVVVNHGCNRTPSAVNVQLSLRAESTNDSGYVYVDTFTSTQMTVHCRNDPGTSGLFGQAQISIL